MFNTAKSTVSEDIEILSGSFAKYDRGQIQTLPGAAGGVRFRGVFSREKTEEILKSVCETLNEGGRLLPGGFLYTSDIASDPSVTSDLGTIIASRYYDKTPDIVLTMETKGIPLALMTARALNATLVVARRDSKAYEGSAVKINYISGGDGNRMETMALSRRAVKAGQKALIVDDFAKGGGTLQGMVDMMKEFQSEVVGVEVMIASLACREKLVPGTHALFYVNTDEDGCKVTPAHFE